MVERHFFRKKGRESPKLAWES